MLSHDQYSMEIFQSSSLLFEFYKFLLLISKVRKVQPLLSQQRWNFLRCFVINHSEDRYQQSNLWGK